MFVSETTTTTFVCPNCGNRLLSGNNGALRCDEHGLFFAYGPQLLVRAPQPEERLADRSMPWEREQIDEDGR